LVLRNVLRASASALALWASAASAQDKPATEEGAAALAKTLSALFGPSVGGAGAPVSVKADGADYAVTADLAALFKGAAALGVTYDAAALTYRFAEQQDGLWRASFKGPLSVAAHMPNGTSVMKAGDMDYVALFDPATQWLRDSTVAIGRQTIDVHADALNETITVATLKMHAAAEAGADGSMTTKANETFGATDIKVSVAPKGKTAPMAFTLSSGGGGADVVASGLKPDNVLGLWRLLVANPQRPLLATHEAELKALLTDFFARAVGFGETFAFDKVTVHTQAGDATVGKVSGGADVLASGADSALGETIVAENLDLSRTMIPPAYLDLAPTSFSFGVKVSGFDVDAAAKVMIAAIHLSGDGPVVGDDDMAKAMMIVDASPVVIDLPDSHVTAPKLDLSYRGQIRLVDGKPQGKVTLLARHFDATGAAITALPGVGADAAQPLALATGLGKDEGDGALSWEVEVAADGTISVNGAPMGKLPAK